MHKNICSSKSILCEKWNSNYNAGTWDLLVKNQLPMCLICYSIQDDIVLFQWMVIPFPQSICLCTQIITLAFSHTLAENSGRTGSPQLKQLPCRISSIDVQYHVWEWSGRCNIVPTAWHSRVQHCRLDIEWSSKCLFHRFSLPLPLHTSLIQSLPHHLWLLTFLDYE